VISCPDFYRSTNHGCDNAMPHTLSLHDALPIYDPVLEARIKACRESGGNPFFEYQLPSAAIALKQGAGRLIRTEKDWGLPVVGRSEEHTSELQSREKIVCRLLLERKKESNASAD